MSAFVSASYDDSRMTEMSDWTFEIRERSAGVYEGVGTHTSGASVAATDDDPDRLQRRLHSDAENLAVS